MQGPSKIQENHLYKLLGNIPTPNQACTRLPISRNKMKNTLNLIISGKKVNTFPNCRNVQESSMHLDAPKLFTLLLAVRAKSYQMALKCQMPCSVFYIQHFI